LIDFYVFLKNETGKTFDYPVNSTFWLTKVIKKIGYIVLSQGKKAIKRLFLL